MAKNLTTFKGVRSVDFKIMASGDGVVNWNGPTAVANADGKEVNNHSMPKLRGYTNYSGRTSEKGYAFKKQADDIDFAKNPLYVGVNCIRHHLFIDNTFDPLFAGKKDKDLQDRLLASDVGVLRGFVFPATGAMRASPLLLTSLVDQLGNGNFEIMTRSGPKKEKSSEDEKSDTSFFSKTTFGETAYVGYGSLNIEQLSFVSLDAKFGRPAIVESTEERANTLVTLLSNYVQQLDPGRKFKEPIAVFHENYVRKGAIAFTEGQAGILFSQEAIDTIVSHTLNKISELAIVQGGGFLTVDSILVDYNDSPKPLRIRADESLAQSERTADYGQYYEAQ